jgi:hypothetical protein
MTYTSVDQLNGETLLALAKMELEKRYWRNIKRGYDHKTSLSMSLEGLRLAVGVTQNHATEIS